MSPPSLSKACKSLSKVVFVLRVTALLEGLSLSWLEVMWHHRQQWRPDHEVFLSTSASLICKLFFNLPLAPDRPYILVRKFIVATYEYHNFFSHCSFIVELTFTIVCTKNYASYFQVISYLRTSRSLSSAGYSVRYVHSLCMHSRVCDMYLLLFQTCNYHRSPEDHLEPSLQQMKERPSCLGLLVVKSAFSPRIWRTGTSTLNPLLWSSERIFWRSAGERALSSAWSWWTSFPPLASRLCLLSSVVLFLTVSLDAVPESTLGFETLTNVSG